MWPEHVSALGRLALCVRVNLSLCPLVLAPLAPTRDKDQGQGRDQGRDLRCVGMVTNLQMKGHSDGSTPEVKPLDIEPTALDLLRLQWIGSQLGSEPGNKGQGTKTGRVLEPAAWVDSPMSSPVREAPPLAGAELVLGPG